MDVDRELPIETVRTAWEQYALCTLATSREQRDCESMFIRLHYHPQAKQLTW